MTTPDGHESTSALQRVLTEFQGRRLFTMRFKGRVCWTAQNLSLAFGYSDPKHLSREITGAWSQEFEEGQHFEVLKGQKLKEFRGLLELVADGATSSIPGLDPRAPSLTIVFEEGLHKVHLKSETEAGRALREHLASEVMPQLARTGRYDPDAGKALPPPAVTREELSRLLRDVLAEERERIREELRAELTAHAGGSVCLEARLSMVEVKAPLRDLARRLAKVDPVFSRASHCARLHTELRDLLRVSMHLAWANLPMARLGEVRGFVAVRRRAVEDREAHLRAQTEAAEKARQQELFKN